MPGCGWPSLSASARPAPDPPMLTGYPGCERPSLSASARPAPDPPMRTGYPDGDSTLATVTLDQSAPHPLARSMMDILVEGHWTRCLFDTGSTESFIHPDTVQCCGLATRPREMDRIVNQYQLQATFPYLDNITICGHDWPDHDANLQRFLQVAEALNLTYNRDKCVFGTTRLAQEGRPVAFFSRTLQGSEIWHSTVEKEAQAIVEAIRHWRHYLAGKRFTLLTDQRSVAFLFINQQRGKIKNDNILRWRIELSTYNYDILYRPGRLNEPPDALSRGTCASTQLDQLYALHAQLCHPGVTRFYHFVKARNLPYSLENIRTMTRDCQICAECKPHFYRPDTAQFVKATRPFERLSVDFKGPLPSTDRDVYFLNIIDEYSWFPFAIPCPDTTATSVIKALCQLFTLFGYPCYIHSDRGSSFMSDELRQYLLARGIATSRITSYNPRGNGQVERENATLWKATPLALKSKGLPVSRWQEVLPEALHSIRSLLCMSTNTTPHERLFSFPRKSVTATTLPVWLTSPGPVLLRKHVRSNKYSPLVERVHLLHANPQYAYVVLPDGREDTVSIRDLAPAGAADHYPEHSPVTMNPVPEVTPCTPGPTQTPHDTYIPGVSYAFIPGTSHMREGSPAHNGLEQHNLRPLCNHQCRRHPCDHSRCYIDRSDRFDHLIDLTCKKLRHMGTLLNKGGVNVVNYVCLSGHAPHSPADCSCGPSHRPLYKGDLKPMLSLSLQDVV
ncbi:uncharacterized protein LOC132381094 isoform X2 [Hypanus sabinus]|uniref:uncharacterized protein LOC132381094 isoform X2 n=1 Tax=Hypanus sabinus TaxID=79690 RepID=UPI0028C40538|nr:uncharacterized protein LOC132381094 isoform X2 [Hypanus sabinus]